MGHSVTLGGDRVGSGSKNKVYLHNYERSTHDLSYDWMSTMGCGMLIPFMCELVTRDDKYEINLDAGLRTIPTKGPLFGSFKLQLDVYQYPLRLCQALLHNNPLAIGLKANQVKFPKMRLYDKIKAGEHYMESKSATNSLIKYLGISGMGTIASNGGVTAAVHRDFLAAGVLAYYDIFKNYYANKQEENAYVCYSGQEKIEDEYVNIKYTHSVWTDDDDQMQEAVFEVSEPTFETTENLQQITISQQLTTDERNFITFYFTRKINNIYAGDVTNEDILNTKIYLVYKKVGATVWESKSGTIKQMQEGGLIGRISLKNINEPDNLAFNIDYDIIKDGSHYELNYIAIGKNIYKYETQVKLRSFTLKNIDDMRYNILSFHTLGESFMLDSESELSIESPYYDAIGDEGLYYWKEPLSGICVKTYQSDIFNNWLNAELIDGENGIAEITAISTSDGAITIDQLQFSEKLYNLLNRIAVSGNTYEDYLNAAYTASAKKFEESPIWVGGLSDEVIFEEIVQTAPATINGENSNLGTLGGRGNLLGRTKGGKITVKIDEPSLIIGIVSLTPRIVYTQGNMWYNTEIDNLQDIHVPALDAIGFQNLMAEQLHFGAQGINTSSQLSERPIVGKVPAWINYMTNFDKAYGDFAATDGDGFMILNRNYECENGILQDATTYIDPAKYNYAFAYTKRDAQNFWVKIKCDIKARRLMSAKQIPTA